jgi:hypothetical protein
LVLTQPWPASSSDKARGIPGRAIHYQYRHDRARRSLRGIDEQIAKAQRAVDGTAAVKRNRFITLAGATKAVNRDLEAKTGRLAGWKGYTTNLTTESGRLRDRCVSPALAHREELPHVQTNTICRHGRSIHHRRESIEAHLSIVFAAMAVSHWIEQQTG